MQLLSSWAGSIIQISLTVLVCCSISVADEYLLYKPDVIRMEEAPRSGEGILAKRIIIRKGDTLSSLSRLYSGKSSYFPQILLFNHISDPDRIFAGRDLVVPLKHRPEARAASASSETASDRVSQEKPTGKGMSGSVETSRKKKTEKSLYRLATILFANGKYREAIDVYSRFLEEYPDSSLAPEAALHRGDCYLRLSGILPL
jgi:TolA-binding protein